MIPTPGPGEVPVRTVAVGLPGVTGLRKGNLAGVAWLHVCLDERTRVRSELTAGRIHGRVVLRPAWTEVGDGEE